MKILIPNNKPVITSFEMQEFAKEVIESVKNKIIEGTKNTKGDTQ